MTNETQTRCAAFVAQLRALRIERGMSTYQLAERTALKANNISRLESGKYPPNLVTIMRYAEGIGAEVVVKDGQ